MATGIYNDNGVLKYAETWCNKNGSIYGENSMDVYYNHNNDIIKFPGKDKCILNLQGLNFCMPLGLGTQTYFEGSKNEYYRILEINPGYRWVDNWEYEAYGNDLASTDPNKLKYHPIRKTLWKGSNYIFCIVLNSPLINKPLDDIGLKYSLFTASITIRFPNITRSINSLKSIFEIGDSNVHLRPRIVIDQSGIYFYINNINCGSFLTTTNSIPSGLFNFTFNIIGNPNNTNHIVNLYTNGNSVVSKSFDSAPISFNMDKVLFGSFEENGQLEFPIEIVSARLWNTNFSINELKSFLNVEDGI